jgi:hypothetical protein
MKNPARSKNKIGKNLQSHKFAPQGIQIPSVFKQSKFNA